MTFLDWVTAVSSAIGIICTLGGIIYGLYIKLSKKRKERKERLAKAQEAIKLMPGQLEQLNKKIDDLSAQQDNLAEDISNLQEDQSSLIDDFSSFKIKEYRNIINDAFYSYGNISKIPDEVLYNADKCCEVYLGQGYNHGTDAKCKLIADEIERRQAARAQGGSLNESK